MEQKTVKIAMLQMSSVIGDVDANCRKVYSIVSSQLDKGTDILVLPEVWNVGWACDYFQESAQYIYENKSINLLKDISKQYNVNIIGGSIIIKDNNKFYNTCPIIGRNGNIIALYSKMHLYSYYGCGEGKYVSAGDYPILVDIEGINYGITICYDIRFPEIYRAYRKAGADILVNCAAWGSKKPIPWEVMTKSRAVENQCYMLALTQSGHIKGEEYNLGESRIIDYKGEELKSIMDGEGIITSEINLNEMYEFRNNCTILDDVRDDYEVKVLCKK